MSYHLIDLVENLGRPKILVLGDIILDRYIWGNADRISQEAPVILLREDREEIRLGGASNVANMLAGLDTDVVMAGVVGNDSDGDVVRKELEAAGVDVSGVISDPTRPTTVKERYIGRAHHRHPHQMLRVDREVKTAISSEIEVKILKAVTDALPECSALLISDYAKGVCTPGMLDLVIKRARAAGLPVIADPASSGDYKIYSGATAITPNRLETSLATEIEVESIEDAHRAGEVLCEKLNLDYAFVTIDSDGIVAVRNDGSWAHHPTRKREVYDITGAGDMVLAMIGVGAAAGYSPDDLAKLANVAGGLEVEQIGVVTIKRDEIIGDLLSGNRGTGGKVFELPQLGRQVDARRRLGQKVVLTNGCFDVLHVGHVTYLQQAREQGDCLVVALNSDSSIRGLEKGDDRPIFAQEQRAMMLASLEAVDYVVVFDEQTPHQVIETVKPDLLVKGGTYLPEEIVGKEVVEAYGGEVRALGEVPGISTTEILRLIRGEPAPPLQPFIPSEERKAG
ncbi:D-glycero-beta-D-manno-heptose 1-phosphate adenylyltransferase [Planctomycetaceae bacterium]|jgi:D-beta-D-heptose 7-phosphate kinase / D-beta-D-heptose 1-phosphate adenosyltransferase|nr:D-glycero-beta-D-manno-heptose 1-phosphate adenylyltransferase [Planctomycetaceae bacterium]MDC0261615.1 D-glycero-beta-D-manno-heptose 1-phosphate adenylyltransferase [Planctomycetaceae bacterium]MDG2391518.1 D-glycero-beta-D-manno-heptose 1-phosphate adenylyltransferase [Planctomycetaceae bacterium]